MQALLMINLKDDTNNELSPYWVKIGDDLYINPFFCLTQQKTPYHRQRLFYNQNERVRPEDLPRAHNRKNNEICPFFLRYTDFPNWEQGLKLDLHFFAVGASIEIGGKEYGITAQWNSKDYDEKTALEIVIHHRGADNWYGDAVKSFSDTDRTALEQYHIRPDEVIRDAVLIAMEHGLLPDPGKIVQNV